MSAREDEMTPREEIAVIGMAGRFPGAATVDAFWANLCAGVESVRAFTEEELAASGVTATTWSAPDYVNSGAVMDEADRFAASFFGYSPREAELIDPQQRIFLECAWQALESAGYFGGEYPGLISVYAGVALNTYFQNNLVGHPELAPHLGQFQMTLGNEKDFVATRAAYKLNLRGASFTVQSGCSTSLVATHLACHALLAGECDMALVGGGRVRVPLTAGYRYVDGGVPSPDGHCRAFDADARGCVTGSGMAVVLLKRLSDAQRDGDQIHAVLKGSAINNDGNAKVGFTAPSVSGQAAAISQAIAMAEVPVETIRYVEAHGTGTSLGDPIEIAALTRAYRAETERRGFCRIGSVKTNIGHLDAGAGVAGLIKAVLSVKHGIIPASLNYHTPNPQIDFDNSPFVVSAELTPWPADPHPRRAGVSSFGVGGTNAHVIVEQAPARLPAETTTVTATATMTTTMSSELIVLSARTASELDEMAGNLAQRLRQQTDLDLADVSHTLQVGRAPFAHRRSLVADTCAEVVALLDANDRSRVTSQVADGGDPAVVFLLPGGGAQYAGMGAGLRDRRAYREALEQCLAAAEAAGHCDVRRVLFPAPAALESAAGALTRPSVGYPALFATEFAMARELMAAGLQPEALIGHSMGECVAACLSGTITPEAGMALVTKRGQLFETLPAGGMLSVPLPATELETMIGASMAIAAINAPALCTASGPIDAVDGLRRALEARGVECTPLGLAVAAHSPMIDAILGEFEQFCRTIEFRRPKIPFISNVTGNWITEVEATDPAYWARQLRSTVRFAEGMDLLIGSGDRVFVEAGPGRTLSSLAKQQSHKTSQAWATMRHPKEQGPDERYFLQAIGRVWGTGRAIKWDVLREPRRPSRVALPTYPFDRQRYWIDPPAAAPSDRTLSGPAAVVTPAVPVFADQTIAAPVATTPALTSMPAAAKAGVPDVRTAAPTGASTPPASPTGPASASASAVRRDRVVLALKTLFHDMSGIAVDQLDERATFLALGFESLFLTQANVALQKKFKVRTTFRQYFEQTPTIGALASFIDERMPADALPPEVPASDQVPVPVPVLAPAPAAPHAAVPAISALTLDSLAAQLRGLSAQIEQLRTGAAPTPPTASPGPAPVAMTPAAAATATASPAAAPSLGPWRAIERGAATLSPTQEAHLTALIARYCRKTAGSKQLTQDQRRQLADPRSVSGFRQIWKEMVYQIAVTRSNGSRLWDVDGNEFIDVTMGFSVNLLGFSPAFVTEAIAAQLSSGIEIGVLSPRTREAAGLLCEITGVERVCFVNTGSEANMAAIRAARTVTGRERIAVFGGAYHGIFDEVLVRPVGSGDTRRSVPGAPGVPASMTSHVTVLDYGDPASIEFLMRHGHEFAAVLVEPIQTRHPALQPRAFLHDLRRATEATGAALIFDEIVTGFRLHARGAQGWYGVNADMVTYGKLIGGGMPMAVVAGQARFLDAFDGGMWRFGDGSFPETGVTFFGGTFVKHPLALAACVAVLDHLKRAGQRLYDDLNTRAEWLATELNAYFAREHLPLFLERGGSIFCLMFPGAHETARLLFFHLRDRGIHIYDRPFSISTAHTDDDLSRIVAAFKDSVTEMRAAGFFAPVGRDALIRTDVSVGSDVSVSTDAAGDLAPAAMAVSQSPVTPDPGQFGLTDAQLELWLACQWSLESSLVFNEGSAIVLRGDLRVAALRRALQSVVDRHEALRTTFLPDGSAQRVASFLAIDLPVVDLAGLDADEQQARRTSCIQAESDTPFNLSAGPLIRASLLRYSSSEHEIVLGCHHLICDGVSFGVLLGDLAAFYTAEVEHRQPSLPPAAQFREFAAWQDEQSRLPEAAADEQYWLGQFASGIPVLDLPLDHPRPASLTYSGAVERLVLSGSLFERVRQAASRTGNTPFAVLLAAYRSLLGRLAGQDAIIIGISSSGQALSGSTGLVGHGVNFLPLAIRGGATPSAQLQVVRDVLLDAFDHQNYTFGRLVRQLVVSRSAGRVPLVSATFNLDPKPGILPFGPIEAVDRGLDKRHVNFDLHLNVTETDDGLMVDCNYLSDLYDPATIRRWLGYYAVLLEAFTADLDAPLATVQIAGQQERERVSMAWQGEARAFPAHATVNELFEAQVARSPESTAVISGGEQWSYRELDDHANRIATHLRQRGVVPDTLVGLSVTRSASMAAAMLGILKAGGAYVPIDPGYPADRVRLVLEDSGVRLLVTEGRLIDGLGPVRIPVLCLDGELSEPVGPRGRTSQPAGAGAGNLAYVIYTSGSTGRPKGVQIEHRSVANFLNAMRRAPGLGSDDLLLAVTTTSFDISVLELFLPLTTGARVVIAPREAVVDAAALSALVTEWHPTVMQATPVTWRMLVEAGWKGHAGLKILCGGEAMPPDLAAALLERGAELWNMYGPTETTVWSTCRRITDAASIDIGRPIDNTDVWILDEHGQQTPIGVAGELYIGGAGLARGYQGAPVLTAERFPTHVAKPSSRFYRTGDLCRWNAGGTLEYLGRLDTQVKIRGFRIELGEIEAVLGTHESVRQCALIVREDVAGDPRLVAYVEGPDAAEAPMILRQHLEKSLPDYMVPSAFVTLEALPQTPNGKIDRKALPAPEWASLAAGEVYLAPQGDTEAAVARIWGELLGLDRVGAHDNFFLSGGHSLLAMRLLHRVNEAFGIALAPAALFQHPRLSDLARHIDESKSPSPTVSHQDALVQIAKGGSGTPFFWVHGIGGEVFSYLHLSRRLGAARPVYGFAADWSQLTNGDPLTLEKMATHYVRELRRLLPNGPYHLGGFCSAAMLAFEMARQLSLDDGTPGVLVALDYNAPAASPSGMQAVNAFAANLPKWLKEDALLSGTDDLLGRARSGVHRIVAQLGTRWRHSQEKPTGTDLRDELGMWRFPDYQLPMLKAHNDALRSYKPRPFRVRVVVCRPRTAPLFGPWARGYDPEWDRLALGGVEAHSVKGSHSTMLLEPFAGELADIINASIERAEQEAADDQRVAAVARNRVDARRAGTLTP